MHDVGMLRGRGRQILSWIRTYTEAAVKLVISELSPFIQFVNAHTQCEHFESNHLL